MEETTNEVYDQSLERWSFTPSNKFQLNVLYNGVNFKTASIDKDKAREDMQKKIQDAKELKIV
ncbi:MAG: hypothetical protein KDK36_20210 [Leptospiraceae bacterium]|nr:hypothetical protein [Leptospiraceae bacterium]